MKSKCVWWLSLHGRWLQTSFVSVANMDCVNICSVCFFFQRTKRSFLKAITDLSPPSGKWLFFSQTWHSWYIVRQIVSDFIGNHKTKHLVRNESWTWFVQKSTRLSSPLLKLSAQTAYIGTCQCHLKIPPFCVYVMKWFKMFNEFSVNHWLKKKTQLCEFKAAWFLRQKREIHQWWNKYTVTWRACCE